MPKISELPAGTPTLAGIVPVVENGVTKRVPISSLKALVGAYDNAGAHNALYRGKDLTAYFSSGDMSAAIANGTFADIYPGDYVTKSITVGGTTYNVKWVVAGINTLLYTDNALKSNHVVMVPEGIIGKAVMNDTNTTEGGYAGSKMFTETIPLYAAAITAAFGASHVVKHSVLLSQSVNNALDSMCGMGNRGAAVDNWNTWTEVTCNLMNEMMVYGSLIWTSGAGEARSCPIQLPAFRHDPSLMWAKNNNFWLSSVARSGVFAFVGGVVGGANNGGASYSYGVRPYFLLK